MFRDVSLPDLTPEERAAVYTAATTTLCQLHSIDVDKLNLDNFGRKSGYCHRQVCARYAGDMCLHAQHVWRHGMEVHVAYVYMQARCNLPGKVL